MCRYIGDAQRKTPKKITIELTGSVSTDVSKNIYDLAGNCYELTMEAINTNRRVVRGGNFDGARPVSIRGSNGPTDCYGDVSFRPTLYIK